MKPTIMSMTMHNPITTTKTAYAKFREHFNVSFLCAVYNVWLMLIMCLSVVLSAVVYLVTELINGARESRRPLPQTKDYRPAVTGEGRMPPTACGTGAGESERSNSCSA